MTSAIATRTWQGIDLRLALRLASANLDRHRDELNALNVFPVPDGDTGTNMSLTMHGALDAVNALPDDAAVPTVARAFAHGALMGARGNSGVILSQFFRGIASALDDVSGIDGDAMRAALVSAGKAAYAAVDHPVEGTMLTVIRAAGTSTNSTDEEQPSVQDVLDGALEAATAALANTPGQLDILRQTGVIDAGGQGIVHLLDGLAQSARGEGIAPPGHTPLDGASLPRPDFGGDTHRFDNAGYCTNFMLYGDSMDLIALRSAIGSMGDSVVVVGDPTMLKVHVHTHDPLQVLSRAAGLGDIDQVRIDDMNRQRDAMVAARPPAQPGASAQAAGDLSPITIVAVAPGPGIGDAFRSLGAGIIISGGYGNNPSTNDLLRAIDSAATDQVLLLPNNSNILLSAFGVGTHSLKTVRVVPTTSVPAGLIALSTFNIDLDLDTNARQMEDASASAVAINIATAARDCTIDGVTVSKGKVIGLLDDRPVAAGDTDVEVVRQALEQASISDPELFTIFAGEGVSSADQDILSVELAALWPDSTIEMHSGGQTHHRFIITVE